MEELQLSPARTALVAIDLQSLDLSRSTLPRDAQVVVRNTAQIATAPSSS